MDFWKDDVEQKIVHFLVENALRQDARLEHASRPVNHGPTVLVSGRDCVSARDRFDE